MEQIKREMLLDTPITLIVLNIYTRSLYVDFHTPNIDVRYRVFL
jgi:hypothetical protein